LSSYFGRFNYSWKEKYLLTATLRADGASNFAKGHQWGYFPSVSAGWRFSEEKFIKSFSSDFLSNGKLRLSWGQTGNYNVGNGALDYYGADPWYGSQFGDSQHVGIYVSQLGNPNLTWETTTEFNIGLDLGFFNNRINLTAEYFQRTISDLLVKDKTIPHYNEVKTIAANIGSTQSNGVELTLNTQNIQTAQFAWSTDLTFSTYNDRWKERDPNWKPAAYQKEQDPIRGVFAYIADGLLQPGEEAPAHQPQLLPGQVKLKNINGDDKLNEEDMVLIGRNDPKFIFGFNNNFSYKNFDLNIYMYGQVGKIAGANSYYDAWGSYGNRIKLGQNVPVSFKDAWSSDNQTSTRPSFIESAYGTGDLFLQKISFLRIRNITLGYTVPVSKSICNRLRVYADVNNPCVWTNWKGQDPETDSNTNAYPNVTSFSIGVDISF
jgi:TonB-linked SusC/RagA family outer membrane protein